MFYVFIYPLNPKSPSTTRIQPNTFTKFRRNRLSDCGDKRVAKTNTWPTWRLARVFVSKLKSNFVIFRKWCRFYILPSDPTDVILSNAWSLNTLKKYNFPRHFNIFPFIKNLLLAIINRIKKEITKSVQPGTRDTDGNYGK